jgi:tRNA nucleotidyltransferase/poly(A) polymerase
VLCFSSAQWIVMDNPQLIEKLGQQIPVYSVFFDSLHASGLTAWLVGGCVRDLLLGNECADVDIVSTEDPSAWARAWAKGRGHWFWLDEQRRQSRILLPDGMSFDFAPLRAPTIADDLKARDFTINAIAVSVNESTLLFDPLDGAADLKKRQLKMCSACSFSDDPLRILKGIRHAAVLDFTIDDQTITAMRLKAHLLKQVAAERIRDELLKIVAVRDFAYVLDILIRTNILQVLLGKPDTSWSERDYDTNHRFLCERLDAFCGEDRLAISKKLHQQRPIFHLAALLVAYTSQPFVHMYPLLRLSRTQQRLLGALCHELPKLWLQQLSRLSSVRQHALAVEQLHPCGEERILYHGWCREQLQDDIAIALLMAYEQQQVNGRIPDLLDGHVITQYAGTDKSIIGELLQQIKTLEIEGRIHSVADAHAWLLVHFGFDKN